MNYVQKVHITNFWGDKTVKIDFGPKENFLIGVNGSGKTTIINLIAAAMEADFRSLDNIEFQKITIWLTSIKNKKETTKIVVEKKDNDKTPYQNILFQLIKGRVKYFEIILDDLEEDRMLRQRNYDQYYLRLKNNKYHKKDLQQELEKLFKINWLSIHRFRTNRRTDDKGNETLVDQKLYQFSSNFSGYLNELDRKAKEETDKFQRHIFLSLLTTQSESELFNTLRKIDIEKEKKSLRAIYSLFNLESSDYEVQLNSYGKSFGDALAKTQGGNNVAFIDAEYLIGMKRIHAIIQKWQELLNKQEVIFESRNNFMNAINELLQRKKLKFNERNELIVETISGKIFPLSQLSSGEKQLLIIFGETLLQRFEPHIFIADEPELSLHVEWQEKLVQSLKVLNPTAQMIFATHSPDIVGPFSNSVIKIENCIE